MGLHYLDLFVDQLCLLGSFYLYHHFVMMDEVFTISEDGKAMTKDGRECEVCEYTNTPEEFYTKLQSVGFARAVMDKANFKMSKLSAYQDNVFYRVVESP